MPLGSVVFVNGICTSLANAGVRVATEATATEASAMVITGSRMA